MTPREAFDQLVKTGKGSIEDPDALFGQKSTWSFDHNGHLAWQPENRDTPIIHKMFVNPAVRAPEEMDGKQRLAE